jgi:hypothetical protein
MNKEPLPMRQLRRLVSSFAVLFVPFCDACDYCLLGQGISPLQTQNGAGIRVAQRYTLLDSVYEGTDEVSNPGVKEKYWTVDVAGFYSVNDRLLVLVNAPVRKTDGDGELVDGPNGEPEREDSTGGANGLGDVSVLARYRLFGGTPPAVRRSLQASSASSCRPAAPISTTIRASTSIRICNSAPVRPTCCSACRSITRAGGCRYRPMR